MRVEVQYERKRERGRDGRERIREGGNMFVCV